MRPLFFVALILISFCSAFAADKMTYVNIDGTEYKDISKVYVGKDGRVIILSPGGGTAAAVDKVPEAFLNSWGIDTEMAKGNEQRKSAEDLEKAIQSGAFREVDGIVYDVRKPQSGWTTFNNAKVIQIVRESAIVDTTPNYRTPTAIHLINISSGVGDTDYISFTAKLIGNYSYINKLQDDRTIREYDMGKICSRKEIPPAVLSGEKPFDRIINPNAPGKDVKASLPESQEISASGSGFFISEDGYLVTNFHVVEDAKRIKVKTQKSVYAAEVIKLDKVNDLALLKVSGKFHGLPISTTPAKLGQTAFTIGFPNILLQGTEPKYTDGKISSLAGLRDDPGHYQISVPIQPGNSGGPLVDMDGAVIGVVVSQLSSFATLRNSGSLPQNVNYAIKSHLLLELLKKVPEVKLNQTKPITPENLVSSVQDSVVMVLVYE